MVTGQRRRQVGLTAESGRGLLLVQTLSAEWGCYTPDGQGERSSGPCAWPTLKIHK